ncbi:MAG TPA: hypothetical protein VH478_05825 [Trebonia sp.]|jgi:hypothetical protein|nr:hypothetical protein [Trebonia sp.]
MATAAFIIAFAFAAAVVMLLAGFWVACQSIKRTDKWGLVHPEEAPHRRPLLAYTSRWGNDTPAFA